MSQKEVKRAQIMELLTAGKINQKEAGKFLQVSGIAVGCKRHCNSGRSDAGGAANTVYIVFGGFGQAEVDHM